jgi:predicted N-acetyltransferase YhbS
MTIRFSTETAITSGQFIDVLRRSTLGERRPLEDARCIADMLRHANLLCTAWDDQRLIGVARSLTDFSYCCYLADLAVDQAYQRHGLGRQLIRLTQARLGPHCKIILLAAPKAVDYYPHIGFTQHPSAWLLRSAEPVR